MNKKWLIPFSWEEVKVGDRIILIKNPLEDKRGNYCEDSIEKFYIRKKHNRIRLLRTRSEYPYVDIRDDDKRYNFYRWIKYYDEVWIDRSPRPRRKRLLWIYN